MIALKVALGDEGFALLITLLITALLSVMVFDFFYDARLYLLQAEAGMDRLQAHYLAKSGIEVRERSLRDDLKDNKHDSLDESWASEISTIPLELGTLSLKTIDEESKFNINILTKDNGLLDEKAVERFGRLLDIIDVNSGILNDITLFLTGRKDTSYDISDLSELLEIDDVTQNDIDILKEYVTTHSSGLVNVNTASREVLLSLSSDLSTDLVDNIIEYRRDHPFKSKTDLRDVQGMSDNILNTFFDIIDVKSSYFTIESRAEVNGMLKEIKALVQRTQGRTNVIEWREG